MPRTIWSACFGSTPSRTAISTVSSNLRELDLLHQRNGLLERVGPILHLGLRCLELLTHAPCFPQPATTPVGGRYDALDGLSVARHPARADGLQAYGLQALRPTAVSR